MGPSPCVVRSIFLVIVALLLPSSLAAFVPVYGGAANRPYLTSIPVAPVSSVGDGMAIGFATKYNSSNTSLGTRAFRWDALGNAPVELGNLGVSNAGVSNSLTSAINSSGAIAGRSEKITPSLSLGFRAVRWNASSTVPIELGTLGTDSFGRATAGGNAINNSGAITGSATKYDSNGGSFGTRAVRWDASGVAATELANLGTDTAGSTTCFGEAINSDGAQYRKQHKYTPSGTYLGYRAVRWNAATTAATELANLGTDNTGNTTCLAYAINSSGIVAGYAEKHAASGTNLGDRAVRWDISGAATELGTIGTDKSE